MAAEGSAGTRDDGRTRLSHHRAGRRGRHAGQETGFGRACAAAASEKAEDLEPSANEAAKDEEAAAKEHFEEDEVRPSALTIKSYNCTEIVPTLPPRYYDWGVEITVRDCNGHPMVRSKTLVSVEPHDVLGWTEVARSKQGSFLSDTFMVFNTDPSAESGEGDGEEEGAEATPKRPEPLAYARLSKGSKIRGQFCMGGAWRINVNEFAGGFWSDPRSREVLMVLVTVKSVRDADRDNMGRVSEARCQESFWLSIVIVPILLLAVVLAFFCLPDSACSIICGCFKRMKYHPV
eukprot:746892-Hanusia_phi.AAC.2